MSFLYPRLSRSDIASEISRLERTLMSGGVAQAFPDGGHHAGAIFPPVGVPVPINRLRELHAVAVDTVHALDVRRRADRDRLFDVTVGNVLASWFEEDGRSQAAHPDIWPYLTLVVLPDLAVQRFGPDATGKLPHDRFAGGRRNVFQRLYLRSWILGDLLSDPELPLFEDELVGLVDRNLSSDHRLARMVSEQIRNLDRAQNRREPVRNAFKTLQFELRVTDVSSLNDDDLRSLLSNMFQPSI